MGKHYADIRLAFFTSGKCSNQQVTIISLQYRRGMIGTSYFVKGKIFIHSLLCSATDLLLMT
jgi:hypothetical protein